MEAFLLSRPVAVARPHTEKENGAPDDGAPQCSGRLLVVKRLVLSTALSLLVSAGLEPALAAPAQSSKSAHSSAKKTSAKRTSSRSRSSSQRTSTRERFREIQRALADRGYDPGPIDGHWGSRTAAALKRFEEDNNLPADGKLDSLALITLGLGPKRLASVSGTSDSDSSNQ